MDQILLDMYSDIGLFHNAPLNYMRNFIKFHWVYRKYLWYEYPKWSALSASKMTNKYPSRVSRLFNNFYVYSADFIYRNSIYGASGIYTLSNIASMIPTGINHDETIEIKLKDGGNKDEI